MKQNIYSMLLASAAILTLSGCEKENAFKFNAEEGQLNCATLSVDYINSGTRASDVNIDKFMVNFVNEDTNEVVKSYQYSELPEIVNLPAGKYSAEASYGEDVDAEWENPVYAGSSSFSIVKGELTDDVDPIECSLQNMKVEVNVVDETGMDIVGSDVKVVVKAGKNGELTFDSEHMNQKGFFKYDDGSNTIAAELSGTLDGEFTKDITRTYQDAGRGKAYRIRFLINRPDNVGDGDIQVGDGIKVDATISIKDENIIVDPGEPEEEGFTDNMRPSEQNPDDPGKDPGTDPGKDPGTDPGDDPQPTGEAPKVTSLNDKIIFDTPCKIDENTEVKFTVDSDNGISSFIIEIVSDNNNFSSAIKEMLGDNIDLINPGSNQEALKDLNFPTGDEVKTQTKVDLNITEFIPLLTAYNGNHKFVMNIKDAAGQTLETTLWLVVGE